MGMENPYPKIKKSNTIFFKCSRIYDIMEENLMSEIINKITSYNIFNYLFPGFLFLFEVEYFTKFELKQEDIIINIALAYFIGLIVSRIGSLIVQPLLKLLFKIKISGKKLVEFNKYSEYIEATKVDKKIELFSEINNMYRTLISLHLCMLGIYIFEKCDFKPEYFSKWYLLVLLVILFICSYVKQSKYISKRISNSIGNEN
jgi:hypothetical protein